MADLQTIQKVVQQHGQQHLMQFYEELTEPEQTALLEQLATIDWDRIDEYVQKYVLNPSAFDAPGATGNRPSPTDRRPRRPVRRGPQTRRGPAGRWKGRGLRRRRRAGNATGIRRAKGLLRGNASSAQVALPGIRRADSRGWATRQDRYPVVRYDQSGQ